MFHRIAMSAACIMLLWGCPAETPTAQALAERVPEGNWGGDHARLVVDAEGATVELACAHGRLASPLDLDSEGRFDVAGTYTREGPGPVRIDQADEPARYSGRLEGDDLTFRVRRVDPDQMLGPYTVTRGRRVRLIKCQ